MYPGKFSCKLVGTFHACTFHMHTQTNAFFYQADAEDIFRRRLGLFSLEDAKTTKQVRSYWFQKQNQLRKPLLRQFWPKTAISDTDPHNVFRPREKVITSTTINLAPTPNVRNAYAAVLCFSSLDRRLKFHARLNAPPLACATELLLHRSCEIIDTFIHA